MSVIDLGDEETMKQAIASGLVWSGPHAAQVEAARLIASGAVPDPGNVPDRMKGYIEQFRTPPASTDGES